MSQIHIERTHELGIEEARRQVDAVALALESELHARCCWEGDRLTFERTGCSGAVEVGADRITLDIRLGLLLAPLKGTIERTITEQLDARLG